MAIRLNENEKIQVQADFHWVTYFGSLSWSIFWTVGALALLFSSEGLIFTLYPWVLAIVVIGMIPIGIKYVQNRCKQYVVTTERFYVEEGVLSKSTREIPLQKINDVSLNQTLFQRIIGTGSIVILAGNDTPLTLKNVTHPENFHQAVSKLRRDRPTT